MMNPRNTLNATIATPLGLIALVLGLTLPPVAGAADPSRPAPTSPAQPLPAEAGELFAAVRDAVLAWDPSRFDLRDTATAATVVLRLDGRIVGRGVALHDRGSAVAPALAEALAEAERRLPVPNDALRAQNLRALAERMTISLELAGPLIPLEDSSLAVSTLDLSPGMEGVAIRLADRTAVFFPEHMVTTGTEPAAAAASLLAQLAEDLAISLKPLPELRADFGVRFYRFRTTHLAQTIPSGPALFMHRGGRVVERADIAGTERVRALAFDIRAHLASRIRTQTDGSVSLISELDPVRGSATLDERGFGMALTALALERYALAEPDRATAALDDAATLLRALASRPPERLELPAAAAASATLRRLDRLHGRALTEDPSLADFLARCDELVDAGLDHADALPDSLVAAALYALAERWANSPDDAARTARLDEHLSRLLQSADPATAVAQWPWLGWTLQLVARDAPTVRGAVLLRQVRATMWQFQLSTRALSPLDRDLAGGIVFRATRQPLPTWHSARPLAFAASMLGDPRLTPDSEALDEIAPLIESIRFLAQLEHAESLDRLYAIPRSQWGGGVRAAPWDHTLPVEASATTLIVLSETLASLDRIGARRAADAD